MMKDIATAALQSLIYYSIGSGTTNAVSMSIGLILKYTMLLTLYKIDKTIMQVFIKRFLKRNLPHCRDGSMYECTG